MAYGSSYYRPPGKAQTANPYSGVAPAFGKLANRQAPQSNLPADIMDLLAAGAPLAGGLVGGGLGALAGGLGAGGLTAGAAALPGALAGGAAGATMGAGLGQAASGLLGAGSQAMRQPQQTADTDRQQRMMLAMQLLQQMR